MRKIYLSTLICLFSIMPILAFCQTGFQDGGFDSPGPKGQDFYYSFFTQSSRFLPDWITVFGYDETYSGAVSYINAISQDPGGGCVVLGAYLGINAIEQTFSTAPNQLYLVSFWFTTTPNGPPALLRVAAAGTSEDYQAAASSGTMPINWQLQSFVFTSDTSGLTTLWFGNLKGTPAIDTISVVALPVVPFRSDLDGDQKIDLSTTSQDISTITNPQKSPTIKLFRFWLNDDRDSDIKYDGSDVWDEEPDSVAATIKTTRDLEDYALLNLKLPIEVLNKLPTDSKIVFSATGSGSIKITPVSQAGYDYLWYPGYSKTLVGTPVFEVSATTSVPVPFKKSNFTYLISNPVFGFIFEGVTAGTLTLRGRLVDPNGTVVALTEDFIVELHPITYYYDHFTVGDSTSTGFPVAATPVREILPQSFTSAAGYGPLNPLMLHSNIGNTTDENSPYILFVHGWRMETWERRRFAETALKRLYWAGYRGSFGLFTWPTEYIENPKYSPIAASANYFRSEWQAWKSAEGLRMILDSLESGSQPRVRILAHSMGNFVVSEALRRGLPPHSGKHVHSYMATQSATTSEAYDSSRAQVGIEFRDVYGHWTENGRYQVGDSTSPYFSGIKSMTSSGIVNLCNPSDYALGNAVLSRYAKPVSGWDDFPGTRRFYRGSYNGGHLLDLTTEERYEAFSMAATPTGKPMGADPLTAVETRLVVRLDLFPYYYTNAPEDHSGEFNSKIQYRLSYWRNLLGVAGVTAIPPDPNVTAPLNFQNWGELWLGFPNATYSPLDSYIGDGVTNLTKYAFGLNPLQFSSGPQIVASQNSMALSANSALASVARGSIGAIQPENRIHLDFWRRANTTDVSFSIEQSIDMLSWTATTASFTRLNLSGQQEFVSASVPNTSNQHNFYRIKISLVP